MDEKAEKLDEIRNKFQEILPLLRRFLKHDVDCQIWNDYRTCDCGLEDALRRVPEIQQV